MVKIRLKRQGTNKRPFYRIVITDQRAGPRGKYIENVGWYNPLTEENRYKINKERIEYWLKHGAKPSETVFGLLKLEGILDK